MPDRLTAAAREIAEAAVFGVEVEAIERILRRHAPQWRERPDAPGMWVWQSIVIGGMGVQRVDEGAAVLNPLCVTLPHCHYYGPLPEPPQETP